MGDDELSLPKATLGNVVKGFLPPDVKLGNDARQLLVDCCSEFIHMVTSQANEICMKRKKSLLSADDVLGALQELEMPQYLEVAQTALDGHKDEAKAARKKKAGKVSDLSKEELQAKQEELLSKARAEYEKTIALQALSSDTNAFGGSEAATAAKDAPPPIFGDD